ncbi:hypothetical protein ACRPHP_16755 [Pantoea allii]|uniref:hypothetical protein n=1 Tax=Pantoea allii TaxID=574096 RepID=UPI003D7A2FE7
MDAMTTNSSNPVDGDVQALIADCQAEIEDLKRSIDRCDAIGTTEYLYQLQSKLKRQYAALEALTAEPYVYASRNTDMSKESQHFSASVFNNAWGYEYTLPLYTTPPAQLLRPVDLGNCTLTINNRNQLCLVESEVVETLRQQGYEVK